ncbi:tRNA dihydrouridine synthase [Clostridium grantii]|uniref:tRNA-dihydrouridine synthase n=1 Tax=Clostridium grantii DSM 8605 TaxID=1121316 RepID=A0A1M5WR04_9CLOT|nr:tRNA-dihydrouridine synthase family protein [Clostridium grantii]SHH89930.1 tRNA-U20a,U20b-dihydrouridine synthase [Clostridium grantii DSM 8605]
MKFYFAPLEGVTGYIYRNAHAAFFNNVDKYFTPFISPNQHGRFSTRELNDILPAHNKGLIVIPQILTNNPEDFIGTSKQLKDFGYTEINLNLGCPSGTVVSKGKGSGFLSRKEDLDRFLDKIFTESVTKISVKTRIGQDEPEEFYEILEIFNKYPMEELIIHPRVQKDYYKNKPNMKIFKEAVALSKNPLCYNGDVFTANDFKAFSVDYPSIQNIMLGRGLIANPSLISQINDNSVLNKNHLLQFHNRLYEDYQEVLFGERNILFKMKETWFYMIHIFSNHEKYAKEIKKLKKLKDYEFLISRLFKEQDILEEYDLFS